ncbi:N-acetylglucosamine-6-phosphate deacetylase [Desertivirga xinjiangensis]|uniref:N-acetylglucosamine-6-phosphate deacetylase n=1 Tax=Desertivirga xinjiangensis TaxID=539206 RepID=UPI00210CDF8F|nr:N-acetylglucosamine-6-phosphate deacetylase [Pedobacter xinjiangensis]
MGKRFFASKVFTGDAVLGNQVITSEAGRITKIEPGSPSEGHPTVNCISAGFIDVHVNGGERFHFTDKADQEALADIEQAFEKVGTAYTLPTLITSPHETIFKSLDAVKAYKDKNPGSGILGLHLEGPFINEAKRGAHLREYITSPSDEMIDRIISYGKDVISMITIAPEVFGTRQMERLLESGITISAGHSNASYEQACRAFDLGINLVTHLYNAMSPLLHRNPGLVGACFDRSSVYAPIILDGAHCDFPAARIAYKIKGDKLFLISDALFIGGKVTEFSWKGFNAFLQNGQYINSEGNLAGAAINLADALRNAVREVGIPLNEAIAMVTSRPAAVLGMEKHIGQIAAGFPAVFTVFDEDLKKFEVVRG